MNLAENGILQNDIVTREKVSKVSEESFELEIFSFSRKSKVVFTMSRNRVASIIPFLTRRWLTALILSKNLLSRNPFTCSSTE